VAASPVDGCDSISALWGASLTPIP